MASKRPTSSLLARGLSHLKVVVVVVVVVVAAVVVVAVEKMVVGKK